MKDFNKQKGFTLMEILVATVIFSVLSVGLLSLFNYVLKINRRAEALRQASQGMRDFVEYLVKEVRNGQIDYGNADPQINITTNPPSPCNSVINSVYGAPDNKLGLFDTDGKEICLYLAYGQNAAGGSYLSAVSPGIFGSDPVNNPNPVLALSKTGVSLPQALTPPNFSVNNLEFIIKPIKDPYNTSLFTGSHTNQPYVTMLINFVVNLPTGEQVPIYYQTSVSTNKYDLPQSP